MIQIYSAQDQAGLRASAKVLASVVNALVNMVAPGVTLLQLEQKAAELIAQAGAQPAFLGYHGYKNILCTSVNQEVVHCPPTSRVLVDGDIVSIDAGVIVDGMYSDCAVTVPVGEVSPEAKRLIAVTRTALYEVARQVIKPGNTIGDIGHAIQTYVEQQGFSIVRQLVGHGIGRHLHEEPSIPNYGTAHSGPTLKAGMAIAVEPMVNTGKPDVHFEDDGWRVVTSDGTFSAHFEHTFLITETGCEVLTQL
ncbi:MAG: type I methionyl aminopeptidase [Candidatus Kerfeldbacteria bacterium]|nr:type I methionyl aminopeptidase [Candidatus Kerfeldbacteria bacterium]